MHIFFKKKYSVGGGKILGVFFFIVKFKNKKEISTLSQASADE